MTPAKKATRKKIVDKTLSNVSEKDTAAKAPDVEFHGNPDTFKFISKASSVVEGWMKSTKAMEVRGLGCVVQVSTQQGQNIAEAVVFIPGTKIFTDQDGVLSVVKA